MKNIQYYIFALFLFSSSPSIQAHSIKASFTTEINKTCGLEIIQPLGNINFLDTPSQNGAQFIVRTNNKKKKHKVVFEKFDKSNNLKNENGYFLLNSKKKIVWDNGSSVSVKSGSVNNITAHIDKSSKQIQAGIARVITTLELQCK